jgi:hypothetical protein
VAAPPVVPVRAVDPNEVGGGWCRLMPQCLCSLYSWVVMDAHVGSVHGAGLRARFPIGDASLLVSTSIS